jgi:polyisoprenoid-binding protein YceI
VRRRFLAALLAALATAPAEAEPRLFVVQPGAASVEFRAYGLGLLPIDGAFERFGGRLALDPAQPGFCRLDLRAETASLRMADPAITADALGPDLLDAARFPELALRAECRDGALVGTLTLHGTSRPLSLAVTLGDGRWLASGRIRRADWGMGARPLLAGPMVRLQVAVAVPPGFPGRP